MIIDPALLREFNHWFNADLIAFGDEARMTADAAGVGEAAAGWPQARFLRAQLDEVLRDWKPDYVLQFVRATNVDWLADARTEALLRRLLAVVRDRLPAPPG